jgi:SAM-dependent methyltransferase
MTVSSLSRPAERGTADGARLRWPLPALLVWAACWLLMAALAALGAPPAPALAVALGACVLLAWGWPGLSSWRRMLLAAGFPALLGATGATAGVPAWAWLVPLGLLLMAYPLRAWRDAPLFPTPAHALDGAVQRIEVAAGDRVLDAGCGLGHGLQALHAAWPAARVEGIETSWLLRLGAALRCRYARVRQGDMWRLTWSDYRMVYLFQRPESMERAWAKACNEMAPNSWLVSLEFTVPGVPPTAMVQAPQGRRVWMYQIGDAHRARLNAAAAAPITLAERASGHSPRHDHSH